MTTWNLGWRLVCAAWMGCGLGNGIPFALAQHIARVYKPMEVAA